MYEGLYTLMVDSYNEVQAMDFRKVGDDMPNSAEITTVISPERKILLKIKENQNLWKATNRNL